MRDRSTLDWISDRISTFVGSIYFVIAHLALISVWVVVNVTPAWKFDECPFVFLNLVLAIETVFLQHRPRSRCNRGDSE